MYMTVHIPTVAQMGGDGRNLPQVILRSVDSPRHLPPLLSHFGATIVHSKILSGVTI